MCQYCPGGRVGPSDVLGNPIRAWHHDQEYVCGYCAAGKYRATTQQTEECIECPVGLYSEPGQSECTRCEPEFITNLPTAGATRCVRCPPGSGPNTAQTGCEACSAQEVSSNGNCAPCEGYNVPNADGTFCVKCPTGQLGIGGVCHCKPELYNASLGLLECVHQDSGFDERDWRARQVGASMQDSCHACPVCAQCTNGIVQLRPGFIELPSYAMKPHVLPSGVRVAFRCSRRSGKHLACNQTASSTCVYGREGFFCQSCQRGFHTIDGQCSRCDKASFTTLVSTVGLLVVGVYAAYRLSAQDSHSAAKRASGPHPSIRSTTENPLGETHVGASDRGGENAPDDQPFKSSLRIALTAAFQPMRMVVTWSQITCQIGSVLNVHYPSMFAGVVDAMRFLQDIISAFVDPECAGLGGFENQWLVKVVAIPCMCAAILMCTYTVQRKLHGSLTALQNAKSYASGCVFLIYPSVCNAVFAAYQCRELVAGAPSVSGVLEADDRILCTSYNMELLRLISMVVIILFCVGVPLGSGIFLVHMARGHFHIDSDLNAAVIVRLAADFEVDANVADYVLRDVTTMGQSLNFLLDAYTFRCYYWEVLDLLRKLLLIGVSLLVKRGSVAQSVVALVLSFFFFALQTTAKPYKLPQDNAFRAATEFQVFLTITVGLALHSDLTYEEVDVSWYDWGLCGSFLVLVPGSFLVTVALKLRLASASLSEDSLQGSFRRMLTGLASNADRAALSDHIEAIKHAVANNHRRIVVSSPEMASLNPEGDGPYDQPAMETCKELQRLGVLKIAFDRAGTTTTDKRDTVKFEQLQLMSTVTDADRTAYADLLKTTYWYYGYQTAVKRCIALELQNFNGLLELICIRGGNITQVEAREMNGILEDAKKDAEFSGIIVECDIKITLVAFHDFVQQMYTLARQVPPATVNTATSNPRNLHETTASHDEV